MHGKHWVLETIVDDANVYDQLKLFTQLVTLAGLLWLSDLSR